MFLKDKLQPIITTVLSINAIAQS